MLTASLFDDPSRRWPTPPAERKPRIYQAGALDAWRKARNTAKGHLLVLATGLGKTFTAGVIAKEEPGRVLFIVNRTTLREQSVKALERDTGREWEVEQADQWASIRGTKNVVALIQTLMQPKRYQRFPPGTFSLVIADEIHRLMAKKYRAALEHLQANGAIVLGLTATPSGAKKGYKPLITSEIFNFPLSKAQREAWSVPFDFQAYEATNIILDKLKFKDGDFVAGELDDAIAEHAATVVKAAEMLNGERSLIYCPGVKSVQVVTKALQEKWPGSTRCYYGALDNHEGKGTKARNIHDHKTGVYPYLVSCDALREGYDDEFVKNLLIARPMAKLHDFEQIIGRGSRLWPGVGDVEDMEERRAAIAASPKPVCKVIDLACVSLKHKLVDPVDVLGGDYTEEERKQAKKKLKKAGGDPLKALESARVAIAERKAAAEAAAAAKVELKRVEDERRTSTGEKASSDGQRRKLNEFGIPWTGDTTFDEAQRLIRYEYACRSPGQKPCKDRPARELCKCKRCLCGYRQRDFLQKWVGVGDARGLTVQQGDRLTHAWRMAGKRRLSGHEITSAIGNRR